MRKAIIGIVFSFMAFPALGDSIVVAALGDSLTQGYGLAAEDGLVPQLQSWADAQGADVVIINAGVSGDTTAGGLARVGWTLTPDVDAMIVTLGGNDLLRGFDPKVSRENLIGIMAAAKAAQVDVLLIGMKAPGNFGPEYKTQFDAIYPELATEYESLHMDNFFAGFGEAIDDLEARRLLMQGDGIHPNPKGVKLLVQQIGPKLLELIDQAAKS